MCIPLKLDFELATTQTLILTVKYARKQAPERTLFNGKLNSAKFPIASDQTGFFMTCLV